MCANPVVEEDRAVFREKDSGGERKLAIDPLSRSTKALLLAPLPKTLHPHTPCDPSSLGATPETVLDPPPPSRSQLPRVVSRQGPGELSLVPPWKFTLSHL